MRSLYADPPTDEAAWPDRFGGLLRDWASSLPRPPVETLSLFTGAGGLDIAFHDCGFRIHTMVECDSDCVSTLRANAGPGRTFGEVDVRQEDVREFSLPAGRKVDFVIGCPPCQSFSAANRRVNGVNGTKEERGTLFEAYIRLLGELSPKAFLFENVAGITGAEGGKAWSRIVAAFGRAGYRVFHRVLDAADYGTPQHRERILLVGVRGEIDFRFPAPTHGPDSPSNIPFYTAGLAVREVPLTNEEGSTRFGTRYGHLLADIPPGLNYSFYTQRMGHPRPLFAWRSKFSDFLYKADPASPVRTVKATAGYCTGPFHWDGRYFSAGELKRLQTLPDDYCIEGGRGAIRSQIGNAVPCQFGRLLALAVAGQVFGVELPFDLRLLPPEAELRFRQRKVLLRDQYQDRARAAITKLPDEPGPVVSSRSYRARLTERFGWEEQSDGPLAVGLEIRGMEWRVRVARGSGSETGFRVVIGPREGAVWPAGISRLVLTGGELTEESFTAAWKATEAELCRAEIRSDLVQLSGFHTYTPAVTCEMTAAVLPNPISGWKAVRAVVSGQGVGRLSTEAELAEAWGIPVRFVAGAVGLLRRLGYEVRNHGTNPRIKRGQFLVPYCFPTLRPKSVQLYKKLAPPSSKRRAARQQDSVRGQAVRRDGPVGRVVGK